MVGNIVGKGENAGNQYFLLVYNICRVSIAQWVMYRTKEQDVVGSIPGLTNNLSKDLW